MDIFDRVLKNEISYVICLKLEVEITFYLMYHSISISR